MFTVSSSMFTPDTDCRWATRIDLVSVMPCHCEVEAMVADFVALPASLTSCA